MADCRWPWASDAMVPLVGTKNTGDRDEIVYAVAQLTRVCKSACVVSPSGRAEAGYSERYVLSSAEAVSTIAKLVYDDASSVEAKLNAANEDSESKSSSSKASFQDETWRKLTPNLSSQAAKS